MSFDLLLDSGQIVMPAQIGKDIAKAADLLKKNELVAIPTETVYGLAGNALMPEALVKIFEAKNRPQFNPLIAHTDQFPKVIPFLQSIPELAYRLAEAFWPGPMTLLLPRKETFPDLLTAGSPMVAIRVPSHPLTRTLLQELDFPLAAPSANPFGYISPTTAQHVWEQLHTRIPYILDGGPCTVGLESTILGLSEKGEVLVYRVGGLALENIEAVVGKLKMAPKLEKNSPESPGRLKSHYAPRTSLYLGDLSDLLLEHGKEGSGILAYSSLRSDIPKEHQICLSPKENMQEAARQLFYALRRLDQMGLKRILAERVPDIGLGRAINDRLFRAQAKMK